MKTVRSSILWLVVFPLLAPLLSAQDLSKYRHFTLGMNLTKLLERTDEKMSDVKMIHSPPALTEALTWCPPKLYKISVTYDQTSTEGLTEADMVKSVSVKYGPATIVGPEVDLTTNGRYSSRQKAVASWEDAQYSFSLVRSSFNDNLGLVAFSKRANALAIAEAVTLDEQEGPKREAERQKKHMDDLEVARQKNQKGFRP